MQDPLLGPLVHGMGLGLLFPILFLALIVWVFAWKAIALYHAARNGQRGWFIALLILNTVGVLEIVYLKWYAKDQSEGKEKIFPFLQNIRAMVSTKTTP